MPLIPINHWVDIYADFIKHLLENIPLERLTIGAICSFRGACDLMNRKLGVDNPISREMQRQKEEDGRIRYSETLREMGYKHLIDTARKIRPDLEIGLCLETKKMFETLGMQESLGKCNCVL